MQALNVRIVYGRYLVPLFWARGFPFLIHSHMLRHSTGFKLANDGRDTRSIPAAQSAGPKLTAGRAKAESPANAPHFSLCVPSLMEVQPGNFADPLTEVLRNGIRSNACCPEISRIPRGHSVLSL